MCTVRRTLTVEAFAPARHDAPNKNHKLNNQKA